MTAAATSKAVVLAARVALALTIMLCAAGPWIFDSNQLTLLTEFFTVLVLVLVWNLLAGFADIVSVGQHAFVGVGAYAFYGLTVLAGINAFVAIPLAMLITLLLAIPCVAIVFRLRAAYLAVGTWVVAEVLMLTAGKLPGFGFGSGTSLPIPIVKEFGASAGARMTHFYIMAFVLALTAFGATWLLLRSRFGLGLTAMRDNEEAAGSAGVDLLACRLFSLDGAHSGLRRRSGDAAEATCCANSVVQHHRLDDLHYFHCGDRWRRQSRRPDCGNHRLLSVEGIPRQFRHMVFDSTRRAIHRYRSSHAAGLVGALAQAHLCRLAPDRSYHAG
jgi:ABC-type uncharacterized transport system permease subunit